MPASNSVKDMNTPMACRMAGHAGWNMMMSVKAISARARMPLE
jgi:hypothetical protein